MSRSEQLFPKPPRRMKQPRKDTLREELVRAATTIEQQRAEIDRLRRPWWRRIAERFQAFRLHSRVR